MAVLGYIGLIGARIWALTREDTLADEVLADPRAVDVAAVQRFFADVESLNSAYSALLFVYLAIFIAWMLTVGKVLTRCGHDRKVVLRHWTFIAWRVTLLPVIVLALLLRPGPLPDIADPQAFHDAVITTNHHQMIHSVTRLVMLGLLIAAIVTVWNRVRAAAGPTD